MQSAYLDDLMKDPLLRRFFEAQQPQAPAGLPAEPGVTETHPALPEEPQAGTIQEFPGQGITQEQMRNATPVMSGPPPREAMGPPEFTGTMPQQGQAVDRSAPPVRNLGFAEPPVPEPQPPDTDPRMLALMQRDEPGPQVTGMPKIVDAPDGSVLLTGQNAANHIPDRPKPGFFSKLKAALPDMMTAAIAAGATPSRYGGGPLDTFQGMQVGKAAVQAEHDRAESKVRQARAEDLATAKTRADIEHQQAQGRYYDANAEALKKNANTKQLATVAEQEYQLMNQFPPGSKDWQFHHDLWQEATHGKSASADKVWYEVKGMPGMERNSVTGDYREAVKGAGIPMRIEEIRQGMKGYNPKFPWTDSQVRQQATEAQRIYIATGKWPATPADKNPTLASLAADAYDPTKTPEERAAARQAVAAMHPGPAPPDPMIAEARQARMDQARADEFTKIENKKKADLDYAQKYQDNSLAALTKEQMKDRAVVAASPEGQAIYKNARRMIQDAHNAYAASIRRATKDPNAAEDYVVLPGGEAVPKRMVEQMGLKQGPDGEWLPPKASSYDEDLKKRKAARDYVPPARADKR